MRTQVAVVGAGPAGLLLAHLLHRDGIDSVVVEARDRSYVESRIRAGVLEQGTADVLREVGVGERLAREGLVHHGIELRFRGEGHRIAMSDLTGGRAITVYGQQEVVKDLITARLQTGRPLLFDTGCIGVDQSGPRPVVLVRRAGRTEEIDCDLVAGCDGFHGVCRPAIPAGVLTEHHREYPFGWLGILAAVPPSTGELIYAQHPRGFALHSLRSPQLSRLYIQCDPADPVEAWPDDRVWEELHLRLVRDDGWTLAEGAVLEKGVTAMRSFVVTPMQHGRLYLAGDAAHIVPPTGAKGMNLAVADVRLLAPAITGFLRTGATAGLDGYSERALHRVWRAQDFSGFMTAMLHRHEDEFENRRQESRLRYVTRSEAAARSLAENYVGLPEV